MNDLTAAHRTLPLGTRVVVTNLRTGRSVKVRINDRGPYVKGRKIDLSHAAARRIGITKKGVAKVKIVVVRPRRKPTRAAAVR
jgi:rare lipoprotein A